MKKLLYILIYFSFFFGCESNSSKNTDKFNEFIKEVNQLNEDGNIEHKAQNFSAAIEKVTKAIEINESYRSDYKYGNIPLLAESYFIRGCINSRVGFDFGYATQNEYLDAIADFSKAIELGGLEHTLSFNELPQKSAYCFRAYTKLNLNDFNGAIIDCNKSIELFPTADAYIYRSVAKAQLGLLNEACSDIKEGIKIADNDVLDMCKALSKQYCR